MYVRHDWSTFLGHYHKTRQDILSKISNKELPSPVQKMHYKKYNDCFFRNIEEISEILITNTNQDIDTDLFITFCLQKYEVGRRILSSYPKKNAGNKEVSISCYIRILLLMTRKLEKDFSLKLLNCILKLSDKMIFCQEQWLGTFEEKYMFQILSSETSYINKLSKL